MRNKETDAKDAYLEQIFSAEGPEKIRSRAAAEALGLARISLSANEARLLGVLLRLHQCRKAVEIGTLTGLSAQAILENLTDGGELWTLEKNPQHAQHAREILGDLNLGQKKFHVIEGDAAEKLKELEPSGPFDAVFIDGNKAAYGMYLEWAERNLRRGGLIIADNIFLSGAVWGQATTQKFNNKQIEGMRAFNKRLADPEFFISAVVPTDEGLFVAIKK